MLVLMMLAAMLAGVAHAQPGATTSPTTSPSYPESNEGLVQQFRDILSASASHDAPRVQAMTRDLLLKEPKVWFNDVFGEQKGTKLATVYQKDSTNFPESLARLFLSLKEPKELSIDVIRVESADDPNAKGLQLFALSSMQNPVALYSVKLSKPGTSAKIEIWSLAYSEGCFRWLGKLQAAKD